MIAPLNAGPATRIPLVCVCGVELYAGLARALEPDHRVLGAFVPMDLDVPIEAAGVAAGVPQLATRYIELLRAHALRGPYAIAGYSFGGLIAYEMAQRLRAAGDEIVLVALFDTVLPRARPRPTLEERASAHLHRLRESPSRFASHLVEHARARIGLTTHGPRIADDDHRYAVVMRATAAYEALATPYDGPVAIWRALREGPRASRTAKDLGWSSLVPPDTPVHPVDAEHVTVLTAPNVPRIARELRVHLAPFDPPAILAS
jgi:thioesterase domain-containing protein